MVKIDMVKIDDAIKGTRMESFLNEIHRVCERYGVFVKDGIGIYIQSPCVEFEICFFATTGLLEKNNIVINELKSTVMGKKTIKFTDKKTGKSLEILSGVLAHHVFDVTKSVNEMNASVRWCNNHKAGDKFDCDTYCIEILSNE